jgi:aryl sulfotransferase
MTGEPIAWPRKTRELHNHHFDSTIWNDFEFRDGDIVIATYAKSGTTWVQQIVSQLLFGGREGLEVGQIRRIAAFLGIPVDESKWDAILEHCRFDYMKRHAAKSVPLGGAFWDGGAQVFIHQGQNGRWRDRLAPAESRAYEERARKELGEDCARWLATGEAPGSAARPPGPG